MKRREIEIRNFCEDLRWIWTRYAPDRTFIEFVSGFVCELAKNNKLLSLDNYVIEVAREYYSSLADESVVDEKEAEQ